MVDPNASTEALPDPLPSEEREGLPADLGGCRIVREIGRCGMGIVFEAHQHSPRRPVALKVMRTVREGTPLDRFRNEAQMLAELRHPSITQVYRSGIHEQDGQRIPWFVMEYVPNARSLTEHARERALPLRERITLFLDVCDAVHHAHQSKGIVHRDLKPDNILVDGDGRVKVIDFGIARALGGDLSLRRMESEFGQVLGTLPYMAPEQVEADPREVDARCDVYALGIVLYELLCGAKPYVVPRRPLTDAIRAIRTEPPRAPRKINPDVRGDLETILLTALEKDRHRRYQTTEELAHDLRRFLDGRPIVSRRIPAARRAAAQVRSLAVRHPVHATIIAVLLALVLVPPLVIPFIYSWTSVDAGVRRGITSLVMPSLRGTPFERVRTVVMTDATDGADLARVEGITAFDASDDRSFRRLHGRLLTLLADAGADVVAFDSTFEETSTHDAAFLAGVARLREAGGAVVVPVEAWPIGRPPAIAPTVLPHVRVSGVTASFAVTHPWAVDLALCRDRGDTVPGLALAAYAAQILPPGVVSFRLDARRGTVEARVLRADAGGPGYAQSSMDPVEIQASYVGQSLASSPDALNYNVQPDDLLADLVFAVPDDAVLAGMTVEYADVFAMSPEERRAAFRDRVVVVGPLQHDEDQHPHPSGRRLPGCIGHAVAIDAMQRAAPIRDAAPIAVFTMDLSAAALGALAAWIAAWLVGRVAGRSRGHPRLRRWRRVGRAAAALVLIALGCGLALLAYARAGFLVDPLVPIATLLGGLLLTGWIVETRAQALGDPSRNHDRREPR